MMSGDEFFDDEITSPQDSEAFGRERDRFELNGGESTSEAEAEPIQVVDEVECDLCGRELHPGADAWLLVCGDSEVVGCTEAHAVAAFDRESQEAAREADADRQVRRAESGFAQ